MPWPEKAADWRRFSRGVSFVLRRSAFCLWQPQGCFSSASLRRVTVSLSEPAPEAVSRALTKSVAFSLTLSQSIQYHNQFIRNITSIRISTFHNTINVFVSSFFTGRILTYFCFRDWPDPLSFSFKLLPANTVQLAETDGVWRFSVFLHKRYIQYTSQVLGNSKGKNRISLLVLLQTL